MGIFGDDKLQDERLNAIEGHLRILTETVQSNQVDIAGCWIAILALQVQVDEKVAAAEVDPTIVELNDQLKTARAEMEKSSTAASESWATLQTGVHESFETLRKSMRSASDRLKKD